MRKMTVLWILVILVSACAQKKSTEKTILGVLTDYRLLPSSLNGKVKELKELNYWAVEKDGKLTKGALMSRKELDSVGSTTNTLIRFNEQGTITSYDHLDRENVLNSWVSTIENGKLVRMDLKVGDSISYYGIPEFDSEGYILRIKGYRPVVDTLVNALVLTHDEKGNYIRHEYLNSKNIRTGYHVCTPDEYGNSADVKYFNKADSLLYTWTNSYDKNGNMTRQVVDNVKPKSTIVWDYTDTKLDQKGNFISYVADVDNGNYKIFVERSIEYY